LMYPLKVGGIALASSISGIAGFLILFYLLHKKIGGLAREIVDFFWKMSVPLLVLAVMTLGVYNIVVIENLWIKLGVVMVAGILSFLSTAWIFKIEPAVVMWRWVGKIDNRR